MEMNRLSDMNKKNEWIDWLKAILIAFFVAFVIKNYMFSTSIVEGESMVPVLEDGERIIFNKFVYFITEPKRGDIVIIQQPQKNYVKRVIGLPGEIVQVKNHNLFINGIEQDSSYVNELHTIATGDFGPTIVPEDSYFVLGDNRAISKDTRNGLGFIKRDEIVGRSEFVIAPFDEWEITR